ncbi:MAG: 2TM domain-containing protein [Treponema sp.]|jgi:hypothetical protein|nr:2TM domain-containing protein [Treponema sp.]
MEKDFTTDEKLLLRAEEYVKARRGFRSHIILYFLVNIGLMIIYFNTNSGGYFWPIWAMGGGGFGLLGHGLSISCIYGNLLGKTLEQEIQIEYQRIKRKLQGNEPVSKAEVLE